MIEETVSAVANSRADGLTESERQTWESVLQRTRDEVGREPMKDVADRMRLLPEKSLSNHVSYICDSYGMDRNDLLDED